MYACRSVLHEVAVDLLHHPRLDLLDHLLLLLLLGVHLDLVLVGVTDHVLEDQLLDLVAVLEVGELAHHAVDAVEVQVLGQLLDVGGDLGVQLLLLLLLLLLVGVGSRGLLQKLSVLLLDHHSLVVHGQVEVGVGADDQSFNDVLFQFGQAQQFGDGGVDNCLDVEHFLEGALGVDWHGRHVLLEEVGDVEHVGPLGLVLADEAHVEGHELVVRCVVDSLLDCLGPLDVGRVVLGPQSTKILTVDGYLDGLWTQGLDVGKYVPQSVVEFLHQVAGIVKGLTEQLSRVVARDGDFLGAEIGPSSVASSFTVEVNGEVRAVNFFRCNPKNIFLIVVRLPDQVDELVAGGEFER